MKKLSDAISLDFNALYNAGYTTDMINEAVAKELNIDYLEFKKQGGDPEDFLFQTTNVSPPGEFSRLTDNLLRGLTETGPMVGGAIMGGKIGVRIAPPPYNLATGVGGMIVGAVAGQMAGSTAEDLLFDQDVEVSPSDRPYAKAGAIIGETVPLIFAPHLFSRTKANFGAEILKNNVEKMSGLKGKLFKYPVKAAAGAASFAENVPFKIAQTARAQYGKGPATAFYISEGVSTLGSAIGGGLAEEVARGQELVGFSAEVIGGTFAPGNILVKYLPLIFSKGKNLLVKTGATTASGRETKVINKITEVLESRNVNIDNLIQELESRPEELSKIVKELQLGDAFDLTPAQITGNPFLTQIQNTIAPKGSIMDSMVVNKAMKGYELLGNITDELYNTGDPELITLSLQIQEQAISDIIQGRMMNAVNKSTKAAEKINKKINSFEISTNLQKNLENIVTEGRKQEKKIWEAVPKGIEVGSENILNTYDEIVQKELLETEQLNPIVDSWVKKRKIRKGDVPVESPAAIKKAAQEVELSIAEGNEGFFNSVLAATKSEKGVEAFISVQKRDPESNLEKAKELFKDLKKLSDNEKVLFLSTFRSNDISTKTFKPITEINNLKQAIKHARVLIKQDNAIKGVKTEVDTYTDDVQEIVRFRSRMLDLGRDAVAKGELGNARRFFSLADAALKDLDTVSDDILLKPEKLGSKLIDTDTDDLDEVKISSAYDAARAYSKGFNDAVRKTFVGDVKIMDKTGRHKQPPELLAYDFFRVGGEPTALRISQIKNAVEFITSSKIPVKGKEGSTVLLDIPEDLKITENVFDISGLNNNLDLIVRYTAQKVIDPKTNKVDPDKVKVFMADEGNQKILEIFPNVKKDLMDAQKFETAARIANERLPKFQKSIMSNKIIKTILSEESPSAGLALAASSVNPTKNVSSLVDQVLKVANNPKLVKRLEEKNVTADDLKQSLKTAVFDYAFTKAGGTNKENLDYSKLNEALFGRLKRDPSKRGAGRGQVAKSMIDIMVEKGVFNGAERDRFQYIIEQGVKIQNSQKSGKILENLKDPISQLFEVIAAVAGSTVTTSTVRAVGGRPQGIVEAGAGAKFFKNFFRGKSDTYQLDVLEQLVVDPRYLVQLLKKVETPQQAEEVGRNINAYLISAGIRLFDDDTDQLQQQTPTEPITTSQNITQSNQMMPPPMASVPAAQTVSSRMVNMPQAAPNPNVRSQLAAAFPFDLTSEITRMRDAKIGKG